MRDEKNYAPLKERLTDAPDALVNFDPPPLNAGLYTLVVHLPLKINLGSVSCRVVFITVALRQISIYGCRGLDKYPPCWSQLHRGFQIIKQKLIPPFISILSAQIHDLEGVVIVCQPACTKQQVIGRVR